MTNIKILGLALCLWSAHIKQSDAQSCPDKWTATEHHCYRKIVGVVANEAEAKTKCAALAKGSVPVTIHSRADDTELKHYLGRGADTSFYIGLEYKAGSPVGSWDWVDSGNAKTFHLWDYTADTAGDLPCVYCNMVGGVVSGWLTNDCKQPMQSLVCQMPVRSLDALYAKVEKLEAQVGSVPIGFIYVQLPNQDNPEKNWGNQLKWSDVTESYAGLFFRAEGAGTAPFNPTGVTVPNASIFNKFTIDSSALTGVSYSDYTGWVHHEIKEHEMSGEIVPGQPAEALDSMKIFMDVKDAHPKNTGIKIWRRTG